MMQWMPSFIGRLLRGHHAGMHKTLFHQHESAHLPAVIEVISKDFAAGASLPVRCTSDGEGTPPSLACMGVPADARSLLILVEDADSPTARPFVHLVVYDVPAPSGPLDLNLNPPNDGSAGKVGRNGMMRRRWFPPDPPPGHGPHRYLFQIYALSAAAPPDFTAQRGHLVRLVQTHGIAKGSLEGIYERQ